ncbi:MAG: hypothetical protein U0136_15905 [Bdellovibrionota bacterium]
MTSVRNAKLLVWGVALSLGVSSSAMAQQVDVGTAFTSTVSAHDVAGALTHLPDGDILAFSGDFSHDPTLYRFDANGDGLPKGGSKVLATFSSSRFPSFVQVAPSGAFALAGLGGAQEDILKIDLRNDSVQTLFKDVRGTFDLAFIDDEHAILSSNPDGFSVNGSNKLTLLSLTPSLNSLHDVADFPGVPSGPVALNDSGELYYIKGTFQFPAPAGSSTLLRFPVSKLLAAASGGSLVHESDSSIVRALDGGYDLVFHRISKGRGELFVSTISNVILRLEEPTLVPETFANVSPNFFSVTGLSFFQPDGTFGDGSETQSELAASVSDFFSTFKLIQIRPKTYVAAESTSPDEHGFCKQGAVDCVSPPLDSSACVGANGFLSQINIASVINLQSSSLHVTVQYIDQAGQIRNEVASDIRPNLKQDFIINDMGLQPNTIGTVCVVTNGAPGSWTGGIALYKPDVRNGLLNFGEGFDFALYYPFQNPFRAPVTVPLNTFHLGYLPTDPRGTVANWIAVIDAARDGQPLSGSLVYYDESGNELSRTKVKVDDGGRADFPGHEGIGGLDNHDAVGMAQFVPDANPAGGKSAFYLTVTRYFYDCAGSSCDNFRTAFNLPNRPGTSAETVGGTSTANGEISIVELTNVTADPVSASVNVFAEQGAGQGNVAATVPPRGTRHIILNRSGASGFLIENTAATSRVAPDAGYLSAVSLFYKLDQAGRLQYAYAAPFSASPGIAQLSQYNSFIGQTNIPELFNSGGTETKVSLDFLSNSGGVTHGTPITLKPNETKRIEASLPKDDYGTIIIQSDQPGVVARTYVRKEGQYVLPFLAQ